MTAIAPVLQAFFAGRLITQRNASPETIAAYRDTFRLLLRFAHDQTGKQPFELDIDDLDAPLIGAFLSHLEHERGNSPRTRNARLGAIHSFYRFAAFEHPEHAHTIARVMAIPTKRHQRSTVSYLDLSEIKALLAAPDRGTWLGRRDRALLALMIQTGVRVSELTRLHVGDVHLGTGRHIRVEGKGRKRRATPLTGQTAALLRQWLAERAGAPEDPLFPTRQGRALSRYTVGLLISKYTDAALVGCPSLMAKRVTPHTMRHTAAMLWRAKEPTSQPLRCFWVMRALRQLTSTSTPTRRSRKKRSPERRRSASSPAATDPPTLCSPFSTGCDYVELTSAGHRFEQEDPSVRRHRST
jgi:integrase/recombinase XerD